MKKDLKGCRSIYPRIKVSYLAGIDVTYDIPKISIIIDNNEEAVKEIIYKLF